MLEVSAATDDESDPDHSYDNPYNSRPIRNSLWLPRNPCSLLDLDDTVDLSRALAPSDNPGDLRSWIVGSRSLPSDFQSSFSDHPPASMYGAPPESQTLSATVLRHSSNNKEIAFFHPTWRLAYTAQMLTKFHHPSIIPPFTDCADMTGILDSKRPHHY